MPATRTVVFLIDGLHDWNGTETHLFRLMKHLDPQRYRGVAAVVGNHGLHREFLSEGLPFYPLEIYRTFHPRGVVGLGKIIQVLRREKADLVVTYHTAADILGPLAGRALGIPVISSRRDDGLFRKPFHLKVHRGLNPLLCGMINVSHAVTEAVQQKEGYPPHKAQVIWNGEDLERFAPGPSTLRQELGLDESTCLICSVSFLSPVKHHEAQIDALARLCQERPQGDFALLIVGNGPREEELKDRAAPLGRRVHFLGHRNDVPHVLRGCDVFLQTSLTEGFSNSILQGMATGLPVVVTRVGGNPELVSPECGFLVPPQDPVATADALGQLSADPDRRRTMGAAARQRTEENCTLEVMLTAYMDAFDRAIAGTFPGPSAGTEAFAQSYAPAAA